MLELTDDDERWWVHNIIKWWWKRWYVVLALIAFLKPISSVDRGSLSPASSSTSFGEASNSRADELGLLSSCAFLVRYLHCSLRDYDYSLIIHCFAMETAAKQRDVLHLFISGYSFILLCFMLLDVHVFFHAFFQQRGGAQAAHAPAAGRQMARSLIKFEPSGICPTGYLRIH